MGTVFFKKIENLTIISGQAVWFPTDTQLIEKTEIDKYGPFNHLTVYNNSVEDVEVRLYGATIEDKGVEFLPAGSILVFDDKDNVQFYRPYIFNRATALSVAIPANNIILEVRKVV